MSHEIIPEQMSGDELLSELQTELEQIAFLQSPDFSFLEFQRRWPGKLVGGAQ